MHLFVKRQFMSLRVIFKHCAHVCVHLCVYDKSVCINVCSFVCNEMCVRDSNSLLSPIPSSSSSSSSSVTSGLLTYQFVTQRLCWRYAFKPSVCVCVCVHVHVHMHTVCVCVSHVQTSNLPPSTSPYRSSQWSSCWETERRDKEHRWHANPSQEASTVFHGLSFFSFKQLWKICQDEKVSVFLN